MAVHKSKFTGEEFDYLLGIMPEKVREVNTLLAAFQSAESERSLQEEARKTNEDARIAAETERSTQEDARKLVFDNAEINRAKDYEANERARQRQSEGSEQARQNDFERSEQARQRTFLADETNRQTTFESNEEHRNRAELVRQQNENERIARDLLRKGITEISYVEGEKFNTLHVVMTDGTVYDWHIANGRNYNLTEADKDEIASRIETIPADGLPKDKLSQAVQDTLDKADSAVQPEDLSGKSDKDNTYTKVEVDSALGGKVDKVAGKGLSTNDFTAALKSKLEGLSNYDDTEVRGLVASLQQSLDALSGKENASDAIDAMNEIVAFLDSYKNTDSLASVLSALDAGLKRWVEDKKYLTSHQDISGKQDVIADLENIRSGAGKGATSVQPAAIADMETRTHAEETFQKKGNYLTEHQSLTNYIKKTASTELNSDVTMRFNTFGNRFLTISGNNILLDMSLCPGGYAGSMFSFKDSTQKTYTPFGFFGGASGIAFFYMGGSYTDPDTKIVPTKKDDDGNVTSQGYMDVKDLRKGGKTVATEAWVTGKGYLTQHQDLSEYAKKDGVYENLTAGKAKNLIGSGEGSVHHFQERLTGGGNIANGTARIRSLTGSAYKFNQWCPDNIAATTILGVTVKITNGVLTATGTRTASGDILIPLGYIAMQGHIHLATFDGAPKRKNGVALKVVGKAGDIGYAYYENYFVKPSSEAQCYLEIGSGDGVGETYSITCKPQVHNVTNIFGLYNEPTDIDTFYKWCDEKIGKHGYFPYTFDKLVTFSATGLKTTGVNFWDEQWVAGSLNSAGNNVSSSVAIRSVNFCYCIGGKKYHMHVGTAANSSVYFGMVMWYDINKVFLGGVYCANGDVVAPDDAYYFKLTTNTAAVYQYGNTYKNDISFHFSEPSLNGRYFPYTSNTLTMPSKNYFPGGMVGINNVIDEITEERAYRRVGMVDLATIDSPTAWKRSGSNPGSFYMSFDDFTTFVPDFGLVANDPFRGNMMCSRLPVVVTYDDYKLLPSVYIEGSFNVRFNLDGAGYPDTTTFINALKQASAEGHPYILYYPLREPIVTEFGSNPPQMSFPVTNKGFETLVPEGLGSMGTTMLDGVMCYEHDYVGAIDELEGYNLKEELMALKAMMVNGTNIEY